MAQLLNGNEVITPSKADAVIAKESGQKLAAHLRKGRARPLELKIGGTGEELFLPRPVVRVLVSLLNEMGKGHAVALLLFEQSLPRSRQPTS